MIISFFILSFFYMVSFFFTWHLDLNFPHAIIGLLLFFIALSTKVISIHQVKKTCQFIIHIMPLFFIPASMGLIENLSFLSENKFSLFASTFLSSLISLILLAKLLNKK